MRFARARSTVFNLYCHLLHTESKLADDPTGKLVGALKRFCFCCCRSLFNPLTALKLMLIYTHETTRTWGSDNTTAIIVTCCSNFTQIITSSC